MRQKPRKSTPFWSISLIGALLTCGYAATTHVELTSASLDESGASVNSGRIQLLTSEGQALIGAVKSRLVSLETGFLYTLHGGGAENQPLLSRLTFPRGECAVSDGRPLTIKGTALGSGLKTWTLEAAAGRHAESGFQTIATGSSEISESDLGVWAASGLSGWHTLRLSVADGSSGLIASTADVFFGDPTTAFTSLGVKLAWPELAKHLVKPCN